MQSLKLIPNSFNSGKIQFKHTKSLNFSSSPKNSALVMCNCTRQKSQLISKKISTCTTTLREFPKLVRGCGAFFFGNGRLSSQQRRQRFRSINHNIMQSGLVCRGYMCIGRVRIYSTSRACRKASSGRSDVVQARLSCGVRVCVSVSTVRLNAISVAADSSDSRRGTAHYQASDRRIELTTAMPLAKDS